jgi:hypothetical protein
MVEDKNAIEAPANNLEMTTTDPKASALHQHGDAALGFLEAHETVVFTQEEEKAVLRKIDLVLMPLVSPIHFTVVSTLEPGLNRIANRWSFRTRSSSWIKASWPSPPSTILLPI